MTERDRERERLSIMCWWRAGEEGEEEERGCWVGARREMRLVWGRI